jgi:hypothetical protein
LGLAIVKSICLAHGAEIDVQSQLECGSCFRVTFPRRSRAPASSAPAAPQTPNFIGPREREEVPAPRVTLKG